MDDQQEQFLKQTEDAIISDIENCLIRWSANNRDVFIDKMSNFGLYETVEWFINEKYVKKIDDIKLISYLIENLNGISELVVKAISEIKLPQAVENYRNDNDPAINFDRESELQKAKGLIKKLQNV